MYFFYSIIYIIVLFFLLPFHYLKRPKNLRKRWLREKFGFFNLELQNSKSPLPSSNKRESRDIIWVHAVSVGEVMAALPLIKSLRETYTSRRIILSTVTDTGQKVARERASGDTTIVYLPLDITLILNKILKGIRPEILIIIETELWPNLFKAFKDNSIPIIVLNGRISEKSFKGYKKISFFMKRVLSCVDFFGMQGKIDAERIRNLGINSSRVENLGNFKFDTKPPSQIPEWTKNIKGQVITAGSTHEGEEELIASIYVEIKKDIPNLNLIIAPRHPERFKPVEDMLRSNRLNFIKRSDLLQSKTKDSIISGTIILLDTIGELSAIYGISDIAIIGKSFKGYGGQNPLEPAYWGKPILCGPHMENFPVINDFYKAGAAIEVDEEGVYQKLREILLAPEKATQIGSKAQELYRKNTGAVERAMEVIARYMHK